MRTIIFFDVDNTMYNNATGAIPNQTRKLLFELSKRDDVVLGLATCRGITKLSIIDEVLPLFTYKVLVNGAYVLKDDEVIFDDPISMDDLIEVIQLMEGSPLAIGLVGSHDEAVNKLSETVQNGMKSLRGLFPKVDPEFHLNHPIYQLWMFADHEKDILDMAEKMPKFRVYPWHQGGADFVYPEINKAFGIKKALEHETNYRLICVGDGANDIQMIELADVGIAMMNTRFHELKEKADHVAPHIMEDQLYDFFKKLGLV